MAAPKGNNFWELRSTHGRDKLFNDHVKLWEAACEYFEWCLDNPLYKTEYKSDVDGDDKLVKIPLCRPFTLHGLCSYLDCNTKYFNQFNSPNEDFSNVIIRINEIIYRQKFEGATAGYFNSNIIARDLGLSDKKEVKATIDKEHDFSDLSDDDLIALDNAMSKMKNDH